MAPTDSLGEALEVLVCAPYGRDADGAADVLRQTGHTVVVCQDLDRVAGLLSARTGAVMMTDEAFRLNMQGLVEALKAQPAWSDIPFVLLVARQTNAFEDIEQIRLRQTLPTANAMVMERPLSVRSLVSSVDTAITGRRRQLQMRDRLEDLRRAHETLEEQVAERTAELQAEVQSRARAESALRQSQKMEAVGQLTGGIAHDFNNMLTGVIGSLDMLRRRIAAGRADGVDRYLDAASSSAQRAAALTQRLLAFSRRQSLDPKPVEINSLVRSMDELLIRAVDENITLNLDLAETLPNAVVDPNQLENAILNLAINARDAMPSGGALTIETSVVELDATYVSALPGLGPGRYIVIAVSDTGVGMAPEVLEKVFDPFFTTKPLGQGTGLGLSMVYGFAQQSGGQVRVHSQPGVGTSVKIYLPSTEDVQDVHQPPLPHAMQGGGERVLVVEDDDTVRMLVLEVLGELGYQTVEFADPLLAIPFLTSDERIDLMISDVGLPGMNGRELAEIARGHRPDLPILFVTGYAENAAIRAGFLGSNMSMITKPFSLEDLADKIGDMVQARDTTS